MKRRWYDHDAPPHTPAIPPHNNISKTSEIAYEEENYPAHGVYHPEQTREEYEKEKAEHLESFQQLSPDDVVISPGE